MGFEDFMEFVIKTSIFFQNLLFNFINFKYKFYKIFKPHFNVCYILQYLHPDAR